MSLTHARLFLDCAENDKRLQKQIEAVRWCSPAVVGIAYQYGFKFSAREFQTAIDERWGEMAEEDLMNIAVSGASGRFIGTSAVPAVNITRR